MTWEAPVRTAFDRLLEVEPLFGTFTGVHEHDTRLAAGGRADIDAQAEIWSGLEQDLHGDDSLDADVARYVAECFRFELEEVRTWERMSDGADIAGTAVHLLFARDFAPLDQRLEAIAARLEDLPRYLRAGRERVTRPVRLWNEVALESARELPGLVASVLAAAPDGALRRRLEAAAAGANEAAEAHVQWLAEEVVPRGGDDSAIGDELFNELLRRRRLPGDTRSLLELGRGYLADLKQERARLVAEEWPGQTEQQALEVVQSDRAATFEAALDDYRTTMAACRDFLAERGLVTLPPGEELHVLETPAFMRPQTPFAAYEPPAFFDEPQLGLYYVTPPETPDGLAENSRPGIVNTSVHEAYPGHHLQFACANRNPSLARLLAGFLSHEFVEGWAHYCEQLMFDEGFDRSPGLRLVQLNDLIWRACRVILDVELSTGRTTVPAAIELLSTEAQMDRGRAAAEVQRYTFTPGYQLSYLYGRHLLLELRDRRRRIEGAHFDLRTFHDKLLYGGSLPAALWDRLFEA